MEMMEIEAREGAMAVNRLAIREAETRHVITP